MSLRKLKENPDLLNKDNVKYTYESLTKVVEELVKQVGKVQGVATELETTNDHRMCNRLTKSQEDNKSKMERYQKGLNDLINEDPNNPARKDISQKLDGIARQINNLDRSIGPIVDRHRRLAEEEERLAEERKKQQELEEQAQKKSQAQIEEEQMAEDLEFLQREAGEIARNAANLNAVTHEVDDKITEQHAIVVKVDETIEEAKEEAIAANEDLAVAEKDQGCCNVM